MLMNTASEHRRLDEQIRCLDLFGRVKAPHVSHDAQRLAEIGEQLRDAINRGTNEVPRVKQGLSQLITDSPLDYDDNHPVTARLQDVLTTYHYVIDILVSKHCSDVYDYLTQLWKDYLMAQKPRLLASFFPFQSCLYTFNLDSHYRIQFAQGTRDMLGIMTTDEVIDALEYTTQHSHDYQVVVSANRQVHKVTQLAHQQADVPEHPTLLWRESEFQGKAVHPLSNRELLTQAEERLS